MALKNRLWMNYLCQKHWFFKLPIKNTNNEKMRLDLNSWCTTRLKIDWFFKLHKKIVKSEVRFKQLLSQSTLQRQLRWQKKTPVTFWIHILIIWYCCVNFMSVFVFATFSHDCFFFHLSALLIDYVSCICNTNWFICKTKKINNAVMKYNSTKLVR
jgi:hypothetical protein